MARTLTPEQRAAKNARQRKKWANASPEQVEAKREAHRKWRSDPANKLKEKVVRKEYGKRPDVRERSNRQGKVRRDQRDERLVAASADYAWAYRLRTAFNMTVPEWDALLAKQNHRCANCGSDKPGTKLGWSTDHAPGTKTVRGILCIRCNTRLGKVGDTAFSVVLNADAFLRYLGVLGPDDYLTIARRP